MSVSSPSERPTVVIGANAAGLGVAQGMRAAGHDGPILLLDADRETPYQRPPLSKDFLLADVDPELVPLVNGTQLADLRLDLALGATVTRLDLAGRRVELSDNRSIEAGRIVLCTGSRARRLTLRGADLAGIHHLRDAADARRLRAALRQAEQVVVIGAGLIGLEIAASARQLGLGVTVVEAAPVPALRAFGPAVGAALLSAHRRRGVNIRCNSGVAEIVGSDHVAAVHLDDGSILPADLVVVGIGATPNISLAQDAGLACGEGIRVDGFGRTSADGAWAAGDVAEIVHDSASSPLRHESLQHAQLHGAAVGQAMVGAGAAYDSIPWFWSDQFDLNIQAAGSVAGAPTLLRGDPESEQYCAFWLREQRLIGAVSCNQGRDMGAARRLIAQRTMLSAEELAESGSDLVQLARRR